MGIFSYIKTCKNEKEIQELLYKIYDLIRPCEGVEDTNPNLYSKSQIASIESNLYLIVELVRQIENICDNGDRHLLRVALYRSRWSNRDKLGVIIKIILEKTMAIREKLSLPPVFQEEIDVFSRYKFD